MTAGQSTTGKVATMMSISYDLRNVTYSPVTGTKTQTDASWSYTTPDGGPCYDLSVDKQENIFVLNGDRALSSSIVTERRSGSTHPSES